MINSAPSWADGPLLAFDLETTGTDTAHDRIVTATVISIVPGRAPDVRTWLADPGVEIPDGAAEVHGITTEHAREHGRDAAEVVAEVAGALAGPWCESTPLCVFNAPFDLSLLDAELRRHHGRDLELAGPVVDPRCLDKHLDRYRRGKRTLGDLCTHYRVRLDAAHDSASDALACARLAWRLAKAYPAKIGTRPLAELHRDQIAWHRADQHAFADHLERLARRADDPAEVDQLHRRAADVRANAEGWPLKAPRAVPAPRTPGQTGCWPRLEERLSRELENWIAANPTTFCRSVHLPAGADSRTAHVTAFYAVDHRTQCPESSQCRILLDLLEHGNVAEARALAKNLAAGA
ncbi:DNA polymerase III subunit epsilon [Saccharopolyspora hirsuta]|uniref:DNA polymerase III subunit epsilon n=1 Tax=Saccharopolyspora hirsuta TaxID=1837 RepID=A0A5M7BVP3_SACHI|nr:exonuclease domain-containing protein [Saccharopolyspora hirsuta]KAA5834296.1 DNA polymerase III subunit epsilon [Saccharopolyspora hirsuta]